MKTLFGFMMMFIAVAASAFGGQSTAPEIDAATGVAAITLLSGGMLVLRSRRAKR